MEHFGTDYPNHISTQFTQHEFEKPEKPKPIYQVLYCPTGRAACKAKALCGSELTHSAVRDLPLIPSVVDALMAEGSVSMAPRRRLLLLTATTSSSLEATSRTLTAIATVIMAVLPLDVNHAVRCLRSLLTSPTSEINNMTAALSGPDEIVHSPMQ